MSAQTERCPWCGNAIAHEEFVTIESRIREEERQRLDEERQRVAKREAQIRKEHGDKLRRELDSQRHSIETQQRLESDKKITAVKAELEERVNRVQELEKQIGAIREEVQDSAAQKLKIELDKAACEHQKELDALRVADRRARDVELTKLGEEFAKSNAELKEQIATITIERDGGRDEIKKLKQREAEIRKETEKAAEQTIKTRLIEVEKESKESREEAENKIADLTKERDQVREQMKAAEQQATEAAKLDRLKADANHQEELAEQRKVLEEHFDKELLKKNAESNRKSEQLQKTIKELERKNQRLTANDIGDGAEIDLYEELRNEFVDDDINRVKKGTKGADIQHAVLYKGELCGRIVYDSKNRQKWATEYVRKLREDQDEAEADHAILTTSLGFPAGEKELCVRSSVIVVNPARAMNIVRLLREHIIQMHVKGLSMEEREGKMTSLYKYITSEAYRLRLKQLSDLTNDLQLLEVKELEQQKKIRAERGRMLKRIEKTVEEITTETSAIVEGVDAVDAVTMVSSSQDDEGKAAALADRIGR